MTPTDLLILQTLKDSDEGMTIPEISRAAFVSITAVRNAFQVLLPAGVVVISGIGFRDTKQYSYKEYLHG